MKIKTNLRSLHDLEVAFVSLVDRGANRIPFRVVKRQEPTMLNLSNLPTLAKFFNLSKAEPATATATATAEPTGPQSLAVVLAESDPQALDDLATLGYTHTTEYSDGTVLVSKSEGVDPSQHTLMKLDESTIVVVKGFEPYGARCNALPFAESMKAKGFYESFRTAGYLASDRIQDNMYTVASPKEAAAMIRKVMTECMDYMAGLAEGLPEDLFVYQDGRLSVSKACAGPSHKKVIKSPDEDGVEDPDSKDSSAATVAKAAAKQMPFKPKEPAETEVPPAGEKTAPAAPSQEAPDKEGVAPETVPDPDAGKPKTTAPAPAASTDSTSPVEKGPVPDTQKPEGKEGEDGDEGDSDEGKEGGKAPDAKQRTQQEFMDEVLATFRGMAEVVQTIQALNGGMSHVLKRVDELASDVGVFKQATEQKIDVALKKAETASQAVQSTVVGSDLGGDPSPKVGVSKSDSDPRTGQFDSAFIRRN